MWENSEKVGLEKIMRNTLFENQKDRSSYKERKGNALALGAEEGRNERRNAAGSRK